jgi:hypothetical protein
LSSKEKLNLALEGNAAAQRALDYGEYQYFSAQREKMREREQQSEKKDSTQNKEAKILDYNAKKFMNSLKLMNNNFKDIDKVKVEATPKGNWAVYYDGKEITTVGGNILNEDTIEKYGLRKSQSPDLQKAEQTEAQKAKIAKVMREFKEGKHKSSSGEVITDKKQAIAIALSEAGLSRE